MASNGLQAGQEDAPAFPEEDALAIGADLEEVARYAKLRGNMLKGTTAERTAWVASYPTVEGVMWSDTTTDLLYRSTGAGGWALAPGGMYRITPGSVSGTGVSIGAGGEVILSGVAASTTLQLRDIFSSTFRHYRVISKATSKVTAAAYNVTGIVGTTPITSANYSRTRTGMVLGAAIANNQDVAQTNFGEAWLADGNGTQAASTMDIFSPNLPESTQIITHASLLGTAVGVILFASNLNTSDQLTGLQIVTPPGGTTTAEIRVYGVV
jgi:hypothetical protein